MVGVMVNATEDFQRQVARTQNSKVWGQYAAERGKFIRGKEISVGCMAIEFVSVRPTTSKSMSVQLASSATSTPCQAYWQGRIWPR